MTDAARHPLSAQVAGQRWRPAPARLVGLALLSSLGVCALVGPDLVGQDPARQSLLAARQPPNAMHLWAPTTLGATWRRGCCRALNCRCRWRFFPCSRRRCPGMLLGIGAAWFGGWTDRFLTSLADAILALPGLLLVLMLVAISPGSWWALYLGISLTLWVEYFRYTRQRARVVLVEPAVEASRLLGLPPRLIVLRHMLPAIGPGLVTIAAFGAATAVTAVAALGFISVGVRPPTAEWGVMMTELLPYWREAPFLIVQPVICLIVTVLALHLSVGGMHRQ